jgi:D-alanyl-D-alanine carboxypeptidase (penicillin-binding protein 5/6)
MLERIRVASGGGKTLRGQARRALAIALALAVTGLCVGEPALAARLQPRQPNPLAPATPSWIVIEATTGDVLSAQDPDRPGAPASMTKMMLALLVMEAVKGGQLKLTDPVQTSALASKMGGSQVYLKQGETFSVEEMMQALLIGSANDAAAALAERLTGSVEATVARMNERAAELKLTHTRFASVHGLPPSPGQEGDVTTPRDMALLAQALVRFPEILRWTSTQEAPFRNGAFMLQNSNHLIGRFPGADGLKTGHFSHAGYNVTATAKRGDLRLIAVIMGEPTNRARFSEAARLLGEGFTRYVQVTVAKAGSPVGDEMWLPRARTAFRPVVGKDVQVSVKREDRDALRTVVEITKGLRAPVRKGQPVGTLIVRLGDRDLVRAPVESPTTVRRSFFWWLTPWR